MWIRADYWDYDSISYRIVTSSLPTFSIIEETGQLFLSKPIDREQSDKVWLKIRATALDTHEFDELELEFDIIDRNDNEPIFINAPSIITAPPAHYVATSDKSKGSQTLESKLN